MEVLWGSGEQLGALQMAVRALVMFFVLMVVLRLGGARIFGKTTSFDNVVLIALGGVAARGIVGASPYGATVSACVTIVVLHRAIAWVVMKWPSALRVFEGRRVVVVRRGEVLEDQLARVTMTRQEVEECLRLALHSDSLADIEEAALETNGKISFVRKTDAES
jgi:uncharacterized membrane protein YcaP (DUF421 family)